MDIETELYTADSVADMDCEVCDASEALRDTKLVDACKDSDADALARLAERLVEREAEA